MKVTCGAWRGSFFLTWGVENVTRVQTKRHLMFNFGIRIPIFINSIWFFGAPFMNHESFLLSHATPSSSPFKKTNGKIISKNYQILMQLHRPTLALSRASPFFFFVWCWPSLIYAKKYNGHYQLFIRGILTFDYLTFNKPSPKHNVFIYVNSLPNRWVASHELIILKITLLLF